MLKSLIPIIIAVICLLNDVFSQNADTTVFDDKIREVDGTLESITESMLEMKSALDALKKIKVSGYIQSQFQIAEESGISSFAGGNFPANVKSRFAIRHGRLKVNYSNDLTQYVLQINVTQSGVGIKDAYVSVKEPWLGAISLTAGAFDRPFGFEIGYSSGNRESPERTRLFQTLFPGDRELGAKIEINTEEGYISIFNLKAGFFNGVLNDANENDRNKDFIGRLGLQLPFHDENLAIDGGFSLYSGKVTNNSKYVYAYDGSPLIRKYSIDSSLTNTGSSHDRVYYGGDIQIYYDMSGIGGLSLRAEFITGKQPGTADLNSFYNPKSPNTPLYERNFAGWYLNYVQNVGLKHQFILKYDVFDPNIDAGSADIGSTGSNFTTADIRYTTFGIGWIYHWDSNLKFTIYYDRVTNEKLNSSAPEKLAAYEKDVNDDVLTLRMQFKF